MSATPAIRRLAALTALVLAVALVAALLLRDSSSYRLAAEFLNGGQLVEGGRVQVAGRKVGSITAVRLTEDGLAQVELAIDDDRVLPLRRGTRAAIRAVGQAGLANRFVDLTPGPPGAPELGHGAVLGTEQTTGIVNVDALLDSFGPTRRRQMRDLIAASEHIYAGSGAGAVNRMLGKLSPALAEVGAVTSELALDRVALRDLVTSAGRAAEAVAMRRADLRAAVRSSAQALGAVAAERRALGSALERAPAVLAQARGTLARTGAAVTALRPALREVPAAAGPLGAVLERATRVLPRAGTMATALERQLPDVRAALAGLRPLRDPAVRALRSTGGAMTAARHIFEGSRFYGVDFVIGALASVGGVATGPYDARGHYAKVNLVQSPETFIAGHGSALLEPLPLVPGMFDVRNGLDRRCPGGNVPPAPDGSSPWLLGEKFCSPEANTPPSVNGR